MLPGEISVPISVERCIDWTEVTVSIGPGDILTPAEVAALLQLPPKTVEQYFREGRIPGASKIGRHWRILRQSLEVLFMRASVEISWRFSASRVNVGQELVGCQGVCGGGRGEESRG